MIKLSVSTLMILVFSVFLFSCKDSENDPDQNKKRKKSPLSWVRSVIGGFSKDTIYFDSTYIDKFLADYPIFKTYSKDIRKFYRDRKYAYAWFDQKGTIEHADNLYNRIQNIEYDGIEDPLPYQEKFENIMDEDIKVKPVEKELMLTSQYFALANYVWRGLSEQQTANLGWHVARKKLSYEEFLDTLLMKSKHEFLEEEPVNKQYEVLREQLKKYKEIEAKNTWIPIVADRKKYEPGDSSKVITQIRNRLYLLGDLAKDDQEPIYDAGLEYAVRSFQQRHGLEDDGIIGKAMINELNVSISRRVDQIIVNMERTRWLPQNYSDNADYILINIPEYKLHVYENNKEAWDCNVVVGERQNKTVIFNGVLKYVVFSPHWNVPETIVREELLPEIEKDPYYLEKYNMEITEYKDGLPVIRQKPGEENSLGLVKFMFPNSHNIYLHDSPAKELFYKNARAFSHGCIRVSAPERLAIHLLKDDPKWNELAIFEAMNSGEEKWVELKNRIPVFIVYFTSWVDDNGVLNFRRDIYNNDARLARIILDDSKTTSIATK